MEEKNKMEIKITEEQTYEMVEMLEEFYTSLNNITDYYLHKKLERLGQKEYTDITDHIFNDYTMNPMDMDITLEEIDEGTFTNFTTQIATFPIEPQIGRRMTFGLKENNTNKYLGFIRIASPVSSIAPRNEYFGGKLPLTKVNKHFYNGQTIVPVQPFGYNYLGGKLVALACISNEVKDLFNKKYNSDVCVFETTSLYGDDKQVSMYDGLKPYIKYKGLTQSKNTLNPTDEIYFTIRDICRSLYGREEWNGRVVVPKGTSPKTREYNEVLKIMKTHLQHYNEGKLKEFNDMMKEYSITKQRKRYYMSSFGYDNVIEHILNDEPLHRPNGDKYDFNNLVDYWKKKSYNRWTKLQEQNRLETEQQIYTIDLIKNGINFETIR